MWKLYLRSAFLMAMVGIAVAGAPKPKQKATTKETRIEFIDGYKKQSKDNQAVLRAFEFLSKNNMIESYQVGHKGPVIYWLKGGSYIAVDNLDFGLINRVILMHQTELPGGIE